MNTKQLWVIIGILAILGIGYFAFSRYLVSRLDGRGPSAPATSSADTSADPTASWLAYNSIENFTFKYPKELSLTEHKTFPADTWRMDSIEPGTPLANVHIARDFEPNTNFLDGDWNAGMSSSEKAVANCFSKDFNSATDPSDATINGIVYKRFESGGAAAGNIYNVTSYRTIRNGKCYAFELIVHSTHLENYPAEYGYKEFDPKKVQGVLEGIMRTVEFQ